MGMHDDTSREPCPDRILDDAGGAFAMGAVGGSIFHMLKGAYNSPWGHRLSGGAQAVQMSALRSGGSFAVWGALFSASDCTLVYLRQKEDPWNSIISGAAVSGFLRARHGLRASARSALAGGALLALIEGAMLMLHRVTEPLPPIPGEGALAPAHLGGFPPGTPTVLVEEVSAPESASGGWFRGKKEDKAAADGKPEMLEKLRHSKRAYTLLRVQVKKLAYQFYFARDYCTT